MLIEGGIVMEGERKEEKIPVESPLEAVDYRTLSKGFGWWQLRC